MNERRKCQKIVCDEVKTPIGRRHFKKRNKGRKSPYSFHTAECIYRSETEPCAPDIID